MIRNWKMRVSVSRVMSCQPECSGARELDFTSFTNFTRVQTATYNYEKLVFNVSRTNVDRKSVV